MRYPSLLKSSLTLLSVGLLTGGSALADPLNTKADYAYILDADTGQTLYSKRGEEAMIPASMTKIMTAFVVYERIRDGRLSLSDEFVVSENAWRKGGAASGGSTMFLELGSSVSVENLLKGVIIQSGNDACIVLAEGIMGSEEAFAAEMTRRARELGLESANFKNVTGLNEDGHEISAEDLAELAYLTITQFPEHYEIYKQDTFTWNGIRQPNRNPLLGEVPGADGLKTGHLEISGYGLVGSAVRDGKRRIIVLNGLDSMAERASEARRVMRSAFVDFKSQKVVEKDAIVGELDVWLGKAARVELKATKTVEIGVHLDSLRDLEVFIVAKGPIKAPIQEGDVLGRLVVRAPGVEDITADVVAATSVDKKGLIEKALVGMGLGG